MSYKALLTTFLLAVLLSGCDKAESTPLRAPSKAIFSTASASFDEYVKTTKQMLMTNRYFLTEHHEAEVAANAPFELRGKQIGSPKKGILLVHGLGDSPWSFVDIGQALAKRGLLVRTVLLHGHGTRPADLIRADYKDWQKLVANHVALLKQDVDEVYLGGFSTGANLALLHAIDDTSIKGLVLFSPGFQANEPLVALTPLLALFSDWTRRSLPEKTTNYVRYSAIPTNGFAQYYHTSQKVLDHFSKRGFTRPTAIIASEHDSIINAENTRTLFSNNFTHPSSRLLWYGSTPSGVSGNVHYINSAQPALRISNMSHLGMLFSPDNPYYGINGTERLCRNGQKAPNALEHCRNGEAVWYGAKGYQEPDKIHARLTFNPQFALMLESLSEALGF